MFKSFWKLSSTRNDSVFPISLVAWDVKKNRPRAATILMSGKWGDVSGSEIADQEALRTLTASETASLIQKGELDMFTVSKGYFTA